MSDSQTAWMILWKKAAAVPTPFEIDDVVPAVVEAMGGSPKDAKRIISGLLKELERMPDGRQFFCQEGDAIVPLPEFVASAKDDKAALDAYPFEC